MPAEQVRHYLDRASEFSRGMKKLSNDSDAPNFNSAALLAIHCAISYADALRTGLGDDRLSGDDHSKAADLLQRQLPSWIKDRNGLERLRKLLSNKNRVAYAERVLNPNDCKELVTAALKFETWANGIGRQLNLEGWQNDD